MRVAFSALVILTVSASASAFFSLSLSLVSLRPGLVHSRLECGNPYDQAYHTGTEEQIEDIAYVHHRRVYCLLLIYTY